MSACRRCGEDLAKRARFCSNCGQQQPATTGSALAQRTVTVLFIDFSAETVSGAPLDSAAYEIYLACHAWAADAVSRYGGWARHDARESLLGLFGVDRTREDDAERAVRTMAALRATLPDLLLAPALGGAVNISLRTAVDTGPVVVADEGTGVPLVMGEAIDTATMLARAAEAGESVLGDRTFRLVQRLISAQMLAPPRDSVSAGATWRLLAVHDENATPATRFRTPLVGRAAEMQRLLAAFERAREHQAGSLVALAGPAGIGKSRLVSEFCSRIGSSVVVLRTRCVDVGAAMTGSPIVELAEQIPPATRPALQLGARSDIAQDALVDSTLHEIELLAAQHPLAVVIEDLQWAEPNFLDFVVRLGRLADDNPIVVCVTIRDESGEGQAAWRGAVDVDSVVWLTPLPESEVASLVDNLLHGDPGAEAVRRRIAAAAGGNPLYAEEFVAMLIDDGLLARVDRGWITTDLSRIDVPPTVRSLVAARLDRLPRAQARVLQRASVIGRLFYQDAVASLCDAADRPVLGDELGHLVRRGLIVPEPNALLPDDAFRFRPVLLREISYASLLAPDRAVMHQRCAEWLEEHGRGRLADYDELVGYHYERACRYRTGFGSMDVSALELGARAATRLAAAGRRAFARRDVAAAANLLSRAAVLLLPEDAMRLDLLPDLAAVLLEQGQLRRAERLLDEAVAAAAAQRRPDIAERAERVLHVVHRLTGSVEVGSESSDRVFPTQRVTASGSSASWTMLTAGSGSALGGSGAVADAFDPFAVAPVFDATPVRSAIGHCHEELRRPRLSLTQEARLKVTLAGLHALDGHFADARGLLTDARRTLRELGLRLRSVASFYATGLVELLAGHPDAAEACLAPASITAEQMGDLYICSGLLALRARAAYADGSFVTAGELARRADEMAAADDHVTHSFARGVRGLSLARAGEPVAGVQLAQEALWTIEGSELLEVEGLALRHLAEAMHLAGRASQARTVFATACSVFERKGDVVSHRGVDGLTARP